MYARWVVVGGSLAAGFGTLYLLYRLWRYRERPGARLFLLSMVAQTAWCLGYGVALLLFDPTLRLALEVLTLLAMPWTAVLYLGFALGYTGRTDVIGSWLFRLPLGLAALSNLLVLTNPVHGLVYDRFAVVDVGGLAGASYTHEPGLFVILGLATLWVVLGVALLFDTVLSYGPLFRREALAVGVSAMIPGITLLLWLFEVGPAPALNFTPVMFVPHVLLDSYAFVGSDMFEFLPGTRRAGEQAAIQDLGTPVAIVDTEGRIVTLNAAAVTLVGTDERTALTRPLSSLLDADVDPGADRQRLTITVDGERRQYDVTPAPLEDPGGNHVGYTLVFQDVTDAVRREQRLTVMNRVLRHNLRNDLNVVRGYTEAAREQVEDDEVETMLSNAGEKTAALVRTGQKVRDIETVIGTDSEPTTVGLRSLLSSVADDYDGDAFDGTVETDFPRGLSVETEREVLALVVDNLVENGLRHGGSTVTLSAAADGDGVTITVADDGPGIPEHELTPLQAGTETDLDHGSGMGLWLVQWGVARLGGTVEFTADDGGTTVTLWLPDA